MRYSIIIIFYLLSLPILGEKNEFATVDSLYRKVEGFGIGLPHEKVYLHLDNTCYFVGDTIWYKGYVTRSDKGTLTDLSKILYVELLTPDGYLVERQQLEMQDGTAHGAFVLTDSLYAGYYELRAYTRWMLNFGRYEHPHSESVEDAFYNKKMAKDFFRDYDKLYSRVFPVYDQPSEAGEYIKDMTLRPLRRYFKERKGKPELSLKFFPEGGTLIEGTTCRVAYELNSDEGEHLDAELIITDRHGNEILRSSTAHRGRGVFALPKVSGNYKARFRYKEYDYEFKLPESEPEGISLIAEQKDSTLTVRMERTEHLNIFPGGLALHVMSGGVSKYFAHINFPESDSTKLSIPLSQLPTGVNQLTVHDGEGRIYADRLVFVRHTELPTTTLQVEGLKNQYAPYEEIELKLSLNDTSAITGSHVSLSVRDRSTDEPSHDDGTMLTEMLLGSELKGFVESPGYYFEMDDSIHRSHLDLLMMVQGWRRYEWRKMADVERFDLPYLPEKFQTLMGSVHNTYSLYVDNNFGDSVIINPLKAEEPINFYTTEICDWRYREKRLQHLYGMYISEMKKDVNIVFSFSQGSSVMDLNQKTLGGVFYLQTPKFYDQCMLFMSAGSNTMHRNKDFMDETAYPAYYVKLHHFYPNFVKPYNFYQDISDINNRYDNEENEVANHSATFTNRYLSAVTVRSKKSGLRKFDRTKPVAVLDAYEAYNMITDFGMNGGKHDWRTFSQQIAVALVADMGTTRRYFIQERFEGVPLNLKSNRGVDFRIADAEVKDSRPVVQIEVPRESNYSSSTQHLNKYHLLKFLDKIYIYTDYAPRDEGSWKYSQDNQPEVVVDYRLIPNDGYQHTFRDRRIILKGYSVCDDFYSPDYSQKPLPEVKDYRRTLLWMPSVRFNQNGQTIVRLYNNSKPSVLSIEAEGITSKGSAVVYKTE